MTTDLPTGPAASTTTDATTSGVRPDQASTAGPTSSTNGLDGTGPNGSLAYLVGAFDMLNVAHLSLVEQVRAQCDRLVVGVLTDAEVEALNHQAPVFPLDERVIIVGHLRDVDEAIVHSPQWVLDHADARVYALTERQDVDVDEVIAALELPASEVLRSAVTLTYPAGTTATRTPGSAGSAGASDTANPGEDR